MGFDLRGVAICSLFMACANAMATVPSGTYEGAYGDARADLCSFRAGWKPNAFSDGQARSPIEAARQQVEDWRAANRVAARIADLYFANRFPPGSMQRCLPAPAERKALADALSAAFFEKTLSILENSKVSPLAEMAAEARRRSNGDQVALLLLREGISESFPAGRVAAFHRATHAIVMNFDALKPDEWLILFCHELAHAFDGRMQRAARVYADADLALTIGRWAQATADPGALPALDRRALDRWLIAALDRGLLGEYRAWTVTLVAYEAGLRTGLWRPIQFLEDWLALRRPSEPTAELAIRYLEPRFVDPDARAPDAGLFSQPLVQNEISRLRERIRLMPPPLFELDAWTPLRDRPSRSVKSEDAKFWE
jgi:hypothetical protein